ncbi:hydantoinase B/oxoprolinase family protein [Natrarchaeobius chitinivorans]|uniref:Hydantoinase B/oxoprolinase family protein n=1 Tax=Natrarchaeobius chitinivorans TaxID=1679083 RepID=A0A3N6M070_NATCH|nr:hydantoinase B/oxoprolinase family protein [Natrarchaeobius chitinivorans]
MERIDPVTFQIIKHRLVRVTDEAVEALKRVSGSSTTNEGHDLMVALYTKEGDLLTGGVGFLHHYVGASKATKHIIDTFEGDINEGDTFILNDPYTAALHPPDVYIISPIFYEGELKAFAANFVHVGDIGAIDPGGFSPNSTSIYHEGFQTPGMKIVEGGEIRRDVLDTILNMSRDPGRLELDFRSQIAANNVAIERMQEMIDDFGADTVEAVGEELIEQSRDQFRQRLLDLPDGEWEERMYLDSYPDDETFTIEMTLRKSGDSLTFDFSGTTGQSEYGLNCTHIGTVGGVLAPLLPLMCHDITWNDGIISQVDVETPEGTVVNATRPAPVSIATVATLQVCNSLSTLAVSKMQGSSESYDDRATAVWHGSHCGVGLTMRKGDETKVDMITDTFAGAGGARATGDGVDLAGEVTNVVTRWANAERHESNQPLRFLGRKFTADSGGAGQYRGGVGHEYAVTPVPEEGFDEIISRTTGRGVSIPQSIGLFGGYPGCTIEFAKLKGASGSSETGFPRPSDDGHDVENVQWGNNALDDDDALYVRAPGSGGYGDPLDRDPNDVASDVSDGLVTPETAIDVYGVPVDADGTIVDDVEERRDELYAERLEAGDGSFDPPISAADLEPTEFELGVNVSVGRADGELFAACANCDTPLASASGDWKAAVTSTEKPISAAGAHRESTDDVVLREFTCPECGTLLDTEVALADDAHLSSRLFE